MCRAEKTEEKPPEEWDSLMGLDTEQNWLATNHAD
jgi:hypothetical protein